MKKKLGRFRLKRDKKMYFEDHHTTFCAKDFKI